MSIAKTCIQHKVATILSAILIIVFGLVFGSRLQMALMPDMELPMAVVMCVYPGASPEDIEELVTEPLEGAIMSVSGVEEITSTSSDSMATIQIEYEEGTDLDIAATKLREQFELETLPDDAMDPVIMNLNIDELTPVAAIALMGDDLAELQILAEDTVSPALERIDGVANVTIIGGEEQEISVELDTARITGLGLSNAYISQCLAAENLLYPAGDMNNGKETLTVSTDAKFQSVEDVANMLVPLPTGGTVRLNEVADIYLKGKDVEGYAKVRDTSCVILQVSKQSGANEVETSEAIIARMAELKEENERIRYEIPMTSSEDIIEAVDSAYSNIIQGVILAAIVVFVFLRRWGATLTICVSMPLCIMAVFVMMAAMDLSLNMMSLGGIAMGVGMIVDNSIVVLENIYRFYREGHDRMTACVDGTKEVTGAVIASTLTTEAVFIPLGMVEGMAGDMFRDFSLTIAVLLAASLLVALTLVPLLCYFTLDQSAVHQHEMKRLGKKNETIGTVSMKLSGWLSKLNDLYMRILTYFTRHLKMGMLVTVALIVAFILPLGTTTMVMIPDVDQGMIAVTIDMPIGTEIEESSAVADRVVAIVEQEVPELETMYYVAQEEGSSIMASDPVTMQLDIGPKGDRKRGVDEVVVALENALQNIAGCEITVESSTGMPTMSSGDINVNVRGDDYGVLEQIAADLAVQISQQPDAVNVESSAAEKVPQVKVTMNREAASEYGLMAVTVGAAVRSELTGTEATTVTIDNKEYDVVVRGSGAASASLDALRSMSITTAYGGTVPLSAVAQVEIEQAPQSIERENQTRQVSITGDTISGDTAAMTKQIKEILDAYPMPEGYYAETSGEFEDMIESFADLGFALIVALILVYFVLAVQFESFVLPLMIMFIIPVAFTGALVALPLTGRDFSAISLVAVIMLAGTVVNNSIVLVEYIKIRREMGEDRETAILRACPLRIRPIMMTTLTTVLAMVPMALGIGETNEMMSDMGVVMISGMVISTIVTLVFTPVYYSVIDDMSCKFSGKLKKRRVAAQEG